MIKDMGIKDITKLASQKIIPVSVLVEVCYTCNERCMHCCLNEYESLGLTLNQYKRLFDQMVEAGTLFVILTGGEPFTRSDFMDIVRAARSRYLSVTIFTNGLLLNEDIVRELKDLFIQEVHISIYGSNSTLHDGITRTRGSFEKSISTLKALIKEGITTRIKCPLMNKNVEDIENIKKLANTLTTNVQFTSVITAKNNGDSSTHNLRMSMDQRKRALMDSRVESHSSTSSEKLGESIPCEVVFNGGSIDPKGNVFVCNQLQISGGNILEKSLIEIWRNSPVFRGLREIKLKDLGICISCDLLEHCARCPGLALLEDKDICGCSTIARDNAIVRKEIGVYPNNSHIFSELSERR